MAENKGRVNATFLRFDTDGSRRIERDEWRKACRALGVRAPASILDATFDLLDTDRSGVLELVELNKALRGKVVEDAWR